MGYNKFGYPPKYEIFEWWDSDEDGLIDKLAVKYVGSKDCFAFKVNNATALVRGEDMYFRSLSGGETITQRVYVYYKFVLTNDEESYEIFEFKDILC